MAIADARSAKSDKEKAICEAVMVKNKHDEEKAALKEWAANEQDQQARAYEEVAKKTADDFKRQLDTARRLLEEESLRREKDLAQVLANEDRKKEREVMAVLEIEKAEREKQLMDENKRNASELQAAAVAAAIAAAEKKIVSELVKMSILLRLNGVQYCTLTANVACSPQAAYKKQCERAEAERSKISAAELANAQLKVEELTAMVEMIIKAKKEKENMSTWDKVKAWF